MGKLGVLITLLLLALPAWGGESGSLLKDDTLRAEPFSDARSVTKVKKGESVEILASSGGWLQVKAKKGSGWLRLLSVRKGNAGKSSSSGLLAAASGRSGASGKVVATTGIRGLSEEELKAAQFNGAELAKAESYAASRAEAAQFAAAGGVQARAIDELKAVK